MDGMTAIKDILVGKFEVDPTLITPEATFEALELDSLSQVELGSTINKRLGLKISDAELKNVETLQDILQLIDAKR